LLVFHVGVKSPSALKISLGSPVVSSLKRSSLSVKVDWDWGWGWDCDWEAVEAGEGLAAEVN
jgi:hypothetical protein